MSGAAVAPTAMQKATAAAVAVKAKAKAAFEKIKPKFGERITIAGEPVYLDMPEDSKVHADRIYLKKHYLHEDPITENTKEVYRRFMAEKKVASCKKDDLDILQKGLSYRLQTIEAEAADLSEKRGNSVPLRQKLGHAQGLRDLLQVVKGEVLLCANKEAAAARRKTEEAEAAAAAALDNKPRGIEEDEVQTLVKKFAILILHAKNPQDADRPLLNRPSKNLIAKLDTVPLLDEAGLAKFITDHKASNPLLRRILEIGSLGLDVSNDIYKTKYYKEILDDIITNLNPIFTQNPPEKMSPAQHISWIINNINHFSEDVQQHIEEMNAEAVALQATIDRLRPELEAALRGAADGGVAAKATVDDLKAQLAAETAKLSNLQAELAAKADEAATCKSQLEAVTAAAAAAATKANGELAQLRAQADADYAKIAGLEDAAAAAAAKLAATEGERDKVAAEIAGLRAQIATLEGGRTEGQQAAAASAAQIATLQKTIDARTKTLKGINERAIETGKERDAALAEVERQKGEIAANKAKIDGLTAALHGQEDAKDAAIAEKDDAVAAAARAAAASQGIIDGLQRDAKAAAAAIAEAAVAAKKITEQLTAKDAELSSLREQLKKCQADLVTAAEEGVEQGSLASEEKARLMAEQARLGGEITRVVAERDSFKTQQAEEAGKVAARNAELVRAQASVQALRDQLKNFEEGAAAAAAATEAKIAGFEKQLGEKDAAALAMGDEFRRQLGAAQAAAATGLAEKLREKHQENDEAIRAAMAAVDASGRQLAEVRNEIAASRADKNRVNAELGNVKKALANKNTAYAANLAQKDAQLLAANEAARAALEAAQNKATEDRERAAAAASDALAATTAALEARIREATDRASQIQAAAAAAAAAAKAASDKEIAGLRTLQLKLQAEAAAMQADLRQAGADTEAAKQATAALDAKNKEIAANLAAMTASKDKCDNDAATAAAAAKAQLGNLTAQFRRQEEAAKQQGAQHAAALEALKATHATELAAAIAKAAADAKKGFDERVAALGGEKSLQIAAAEKGAREAAASQLAAALAAAEAEKRAAATAASAEGRAAATREKDDAIAALKQEGVAKEAAAVEAAKKAAKAEFAQRETQLAADREAAVAAAVERVKAEKKTELERALAAAALAATAATAAAVAAARESVMTAAAAELTAVKDGSRAAAEAARKEGSAAAHAADLEKLKDFAAKVLAGQAKAAEYAGPENKPLANILGKLDAMGSASSNDICALVYFVSYFLNTMIKPNLLKPQYMLPDLIKNIKIAINQTAKTSKDLFNLIMAIQPSLLLANKILPRGGSESSTDTMNYFITQTPTTDILTTLFRFKSELQSDVAWRTVRGEKGTSTSMSFYLNKGDNHKITLLYRPKTTDTATVQKQRRLARTYGVDGILEFAPRATTTAELAEITALEKLNDNDFITYEVLFLIFLYASKQYIVNNRASIACTVPMEIINNSVLENPMAERKVEAGPTALSIRVPEAAPTYAEVVVGSTPSSPGPPGSPPPPVSVARRAPRTAEELAAAAAANLAAHMNSAAAARSAPVPGKGPTPETAAAALAAAAKIDAAERAKWAATSGAQQGERPPTPLQLESFSAPSSPAASASAPAPAGKCVPTPISRVPNPPPQGFFYDRIILSPRLVEIFSKDPFCFTGLQDRVELDYRQFKDVLDGVINRFCSGENPTKLMIPPGFIQDRDTKKLVPSVACSFVGPKRNQLCNLGDVGGSSILEFVCPNQCSKLTTVKMTQPTMGNRPKLESGIVLGTTIAAGLKSYPFCIDVKGVASIQTINPVYDSASLFSAINTKVGANGALPDGFIRDPSTKTIKMDIKIGVWKSEGFYFVNGRARGGRRTQKKRRQNSKKFTQRKR